jgi:hypothetical protein
VKRLKSALNKNVMISEQKIPLELKLGPFVFKKASFEHLLSIKSKNYQQIKIIAGIERLWMRL